MKSTWIAAGAAGLMFATVAGGAAWANGVPTLTVTNGGDGSYSAGPTPYEFTVTGSNNDVGESLTTLTETISSAETQTFDWSYTTYDCCGSYWDPGGYILNGVETQLNPVLASGADEGATYTGSFTIALNAGDTFGFYIDSSDSEDGASTISFYGPSGVPEPATWALLLAGFGLAGAALRRKAPVRALLGSSVADHRLPPFASHWSAPFARHLAHGVNDALPEALPAPAE
ncbi:MAG: PEPxxWA-CTERM sorting domain-containing protein [Caulobacteraceae bacterium]